MQRACHVGARREKMQHGVGLQALGDECDQPDIVDAHSCACLVSVAALDSEPVRGKMFAESVATSTALLLRLKAHPSPSHVVLQPQKKISAVSGGLGAGNQRRLCQFQCILGCRHQAIHLLCHWAAQSLHAHVRKRAQVNSNEQQLLQEGAHARQEMVLHLRQGAINAPR